MKTVQDYLDLGLSDYLVDDVFINELGEYCDASASISAGYGGGLKITSFAWRNNDGVKPEYKGLIDISFECGIVSHNESAIDFEWSLDDENYIAKWRPVVLQSESDDLKNKLACEISSAMGSVGLTSQRIIDVLSEAFKPAPPKLTIKEESPKTITVNIEGRDYLIPSRTPAASPKEDKPMKPVYTAEMYAKNELPPVGSEVKVCIEEAGFDVDEQDVKFEGKAVTVKAVFNNVESEKIIAVENEDGNCACYIIECIKPIIKTIKVNGFDVPAPMSEAPEFGVEFFVVDLTIDTLYERFTWDDCGTGYKWVAKGICHSTKSAAIAHAKAMLGIDPNA